MWRAIKACRKRIGTIAWPLSTKLTAMYTGIMLMILVFATVLAIGSAYYLLMRQLQTDVRDSAQRVTAYIRLHGHADGRALDARNVVPNVAVVVYDKHGQPILDNYARFTVTDPLPLWRMEAINRTVDGESVEITRELSYGFWQRCELANGTVYYLEFWREAVREKTFIDLMMRQIVISLLSSLALTVLAALFLSGKVLAPMRAMLAPLRKIEANEMGHRVPVPQAQDEQRELAVAINRALDRIEAGIRQQKQFVSDASHELRTPITVIGGYADMLARWGAQDPDTLREGLEAIRGETAYMQSLIERLLFLARASSGEIRLERRAVAMDKVINSVRQGANVMDRGAHQWVIEENAPQVVAGDEVLIKQLIRIFVENAAKYTPEGGHIYLASRPVDGALEVSIRDEGIGIAADDLPHIFTRFYRVDSSRTKYTGGNGLGLAIAKDIADLHGADIRVESVPGEGTTFTLVFPTTDEPADE